MLHAKVLHDPPGNGPLARPGRPQYHSTEKSSAHDSKTTQAMPREQKKKIQERVETLQTKNRKREKQSHDGAATTRKKRCLPCRKKKKTNG
jgi:hypothetical protein